MTKDELKSMAVRKTIAILEELGIKYRKNDFHESGTVNGRYVDATIVVSMSGNVTTKVRFDDEKRGAALKKVKMQFYNYFNCRVRDYGVTFTFTKKELELEYIKQEDVDENKLEAVMEKIQKLLALSESDNEHEAVSASLMAQKLLAKYNLSIEEINGGEEEATIEETRADVGTGNKWKYTLADIIARNYRCKDYFHGNKTIVFRGYRQDVLIARRVYVYLFSVCKRLAGAYAKKVREEQWTAAGVQNSFAAGFIAGVDGELSKQCRELMIITPQAVEKEFEEFAKGFGTINSNVAVMNGTAYEEGVVEGRRALNAQYIDDNSRYIE